MPLRAIARLIQTMLYARRFFPYYVYNILGGIEEDGASLTTLDLYPSIGRIIFTNIIHNRIILISSHQTRAPCIPLIQWDRMSARHVVLQARLSLSCSHSWTIRYVRPLSYRLHSSPVLLKTLTGGTGTEYDLLPIRAPHYPSFSLLLSRY